MADAARAASFRQEGPTLANAAEGTPPAENNPAETEWVPCLQCGGEEHSTLLFTGDAVTGRGGRFRVVQCDACGLVFTNPRPTPEAIGAFYPQHYAPHRQRRAAKSLRSRCYAFLERAVLRADFGFPPAAGLGTKCLAALGRLLMRSPRQRQMWFPFRAPGRLLDFGCGAGEFLRVMKRLGWQVEGIDVSPSVARRIERQDGIRVHVGTLPHPQLEGRCFDVVTLWNSLEHVHQPRETIRAAVDLLRPGGLLIVGLHNFAGWSARTFGEHWHSLDVPRHLVHFTPATLRRLLESEGLQVHGIDQIERVGWIRHSARNQRAAGAGTIFTRALVWKPLAQWCARWTLLRQEADALRAVAEKPATAPQ